MANERSREQFASSAEAYATSRIHAQGDDLAAMVDHAVAVFGSLHGRTVLDVATGAGHTARAFARARADVTALDLTAEMLEVARGLAADELGEGAIGFRLGVAEALPFEDESFDVVTCRIAAHHFDDPSAFVREARRVLKAGGRLLLVDNVAPEIPTLEEAMNLIERTRDPSHARAHTVRFWIDSVADAGLSPERLDRWPRSKDFRDWVRRSRTPPDVVAELEAYLVALPDAAKRYFAVRVEHGRVVRLEHEAMLLAARRMG